MPAHGVQNPRPSAMGQSRTSQTACLESILIQQSAGRTAAQLPGSCVCQSFRGGSICAEYLRMLCSYVLLEPPVETCRHEEDDAISMGLADRRTLMLMLHRHGPPSFAAGAAANPLQNAALCPRTALVAVPAPGSPPSAARRSPGPVQRGWIPPSQRPPARQCYCCGQGPA